MAADLAKDDAFAAELRALVEGVGPYVEVVQRIEIAKGVTGAEIAHLVQGTVHVDQQMKEGENVIGFKAKRVGGGSDETRDAN